MTIRRHIRPALLALPLLAAAAAPAWAQSQTYVVVRPGYGFNGAYEEMNRQVASQPTYIGPGYTATPQGYVYSGPVYSYSTLPATVTPIVPNRTASVGPILDRDKIEDRLDDQGYDDIKVGVFSDGFYTVRAEDREDRKVLLRVDGATGYVVDTQYRR